MMNRSPEEKKQEKIRKYKAQISNIKKNLSSRKKPLIIEFSGIPKAGKTTVANSLALFLRRNGISTHIVTEKATVCPIRNKEHPDFNIWTACSSLLSILNHRQYSDNCVIIVDRGIFDVLIWFDLLRKRAKLSSTDFQIITGFFLLDRWRNLIDLVICMSSSVEVALKREFKDLLTDIEGSIMNEVFLADYTSSFRNVVDTYGGNFKRTIEIDTSNLNTLEGVEKAISPVIKCLEEISDERVIYIPRDKFDTQFDYDVFNSDVDEKSRLLKTIRENYSFSRRSIVELDQSCIQIVVCCILRFNNQIAVFKRHEITRTRMDEKHTVWAGGHVQYLSDNSDNKIGTYQMMKESVRRELAEELEYECVGQLNYLGYTYDRTHPKSLQHIGMVFEHEVKDESTVRAMNDRLFTELPGQSLFVRFTDLSNDAFSKIEGEFESWSLAILKKQYNITLNGMNNSDQFVVF